MHPLYACDPSARGGGSREAATASYTGRMTNTGRFAPSPTGDFHLGNLRTAILAWAWARTTGRRFVLRIEDIDRERAGSAGRQIEDLQAIGIDWDGEPLIQTAWADAHEAASRMSRRVQ